MLKPDTKFVVPYLAAVGRLTQELESFDQDTAWAELVKRASVTHGPSGVEAAGAKQTLVLRPVHQFLTNPHAAAGWLVRNHRRSFVIENGRVTWKRNPLRILGDLYNFFRLEDRPHAAPVQKIWPDDLELLNRGLKFYSDLEKRLGVDTEKDFQYSWQTTGENKSALYQELNRALRSEKNPFVGKGAFNPLADDLYQKSAASHRGWQCGLEILDLLVLMGQRSGLLDFTVDAGLHPVAPPQFLDAENQETFTRYLAPPPPAAADEIVAVSGGMFYAKESPAAPPYLEPGKHFKPGDPIYIIEVMKMFNKIHAEFPGSVVASLIEGDGGVVVKKGQPLFRVKPDIEIKIETPAEREARRKQATLALLAAIPANGAA
jgi:biotin carboxyl carrier protein